ncbi:MAG: tRNA pseudouridine(13) synthase TruD [Thermoplasmatota archaeon]
MEKEVGMEVYLTSAPGVGGRLRRFPEDFLVEELSLPPPRVEGGEYIVARVRSRNWETNRLVRELSRAMGISRRRIQFAGTKDRRGIKVQMMSFRASEAQLRALSLKDFEVLEAFPTDRPVELGHLLGNRFEIRLRGSAPVSARRVEGCGGPGAFGPPGPAGAATPRESGGSGGEAHPGPAGNGALPFIHNAPGAARELGAALEAITAELRAAGGFPNFFGIQRFGALRPVTHIIGLRLVRRDFEGAVMAYLGMPTEAEGAEEREARARLERERDFGEALRYFPRTLSFERSLLQHLHEHPGDWAGALGRLPSNLLMMFVHACQSRLFNRTLSLRIREGLALSEPVVGDLVLPVDRHGRPDHDRYIPVEGHNLERVRRRAREGRAFVSGLLFGTEAPFASGRMGELERMVVEEEGLRRDDFRIPELPEASSKGTRRELLVPLAPGEPRVSVEEGAVLFKFTLPRGCYATALMREYMKGEVLDY